MRHVDASHAPHAASRKRGGGRSAARGWARCCSCACPPSPTPGVHTQCAVWSPEVRCKRAPHAPWDSAGLLQHCYSCQGEAALHNNPGPNAFGWQNKELDLASFAIAPFLTNQVLCSAVSCLKQQVLQRQTLQKWNLQEHDARQV